MGANFNILTYGDLIENQSYLHTILLLHYCCIAYISVRPQKDVLHINLSILIGLVKNICYILFGMDFYKIHNFIFHCFSNKVVLYPYMICGFIYNRSIIHYSYTSLQISYLDVKIIKGAQTKNKRKLLCYVIYNFESVM